MRAASAFHAKICLCFCAFPRLSNYCGGARFFAQDEFCLRKPARTSVARDYANPMYAAQKAARSSARFAGARRVDALWGLLAIAVLLGHGLTAIALEPSTPLANYGRQTWVMENGLPQNTVQALLQTRDGFVWLGTEVGLVRFDGNGFQVFDRNSTPALPGNDVRCLLETKDGALWIGTSEGLARWKDGVVKAFTTRDGLPGNGIRALVEAANGGLWVWTDGGLARLNGEKFVAQDVVGGLPASAITTVTGDGRGDLWVSTSEGVDVFHDGRWAHSAPGPQLPNEVVEFVQTLPGNSLKGSGVQLALASQSTLVFFGGRALEHLRVGKELPGSRIQTRCV